MNRDFQEVWQFGELRLDVRRKVLWHGDRNVSMPMKELELLSIFVSRPGELITKDELVNELWEDSFVEESNLSRQIYLLRKTLKELGAADGLIENVPRRGYRFTGETRAMDEAELVIEKRTRTRTLIEFQEPVEQTERRPHTRSIGIAVASVVVVLSSAFAFFAYRAMNPETSARSIRSLAVLPFKTLGGSQNDALAGAGLADILTTRLSAVRELKIRPSSAVMGFEGQDAVALGQRLQVDGVLEGTIYHSSDRIRVTARLVRVGDGSIVWSGEFEKLKKDELQLQDDLAAQILPPLAINLSIGEREALAKRFTENLDAYELYLKGRYEWNKRSTPGMVEAQRLFRNAIAADPSFALAYVGLADTLLTNQSAASEASAVVAKALELDPNLAEAHASRGFYLMFYGWQWNDAELAFKRSLEINPNYATAHHWYATLLAIKGETEAAKSEMRKALDLNPVSYNFLADLGQLHYFAGEYSEAEQYCLKALEIYPDFMLAHNYLHYIYLQTGQYEKAVIEIAKADQINGRFSSGGGTTLDTSGKYQELVRKFGIDGYLQERFPGTPSSPEAFYFYAIKHAFAGESEKALDYLEKATSARMFLSAFLKAEPVFERLRPEPRYREILKKMGLG